MKKNIKIGLTLLLFASAFVSCDSVEEVNLPRNEKPTVNLDASSLTVIEGGTTAISITTLDIAPKDIIFKLVQVGGNAVEGVDYTFAEMSAADYGEIGGKVVIPAYATTGSVDIIGLKVYETAGKTATFKLESIQSMIGVAGSTSEVTVTIAASTSLDIELSWSAGTLLDADGEELDWCDYDLDLELYDAVGDLLDASYSSCPEHITIDLANYPDGVYYLDVQFWAAGDEPAANTQVPTSLFLGVAGVGSETVDLSSVWDTDTGGYVEGNANWYVEYEITISGSTYTVTDPSGTVVYQN